MARCADQPSNKQINAVSVPSRNGLADESGRTVAATRFLYGGFVNLEQEVLNDNLQIRKLQ
jgi:hypothetical protein